MFKFLSLPFLLFAVTVHSQNAPIDFEAGGFGADWTWTTFENDTNPELEIIANPDPTGANTSATVGKFTALQTGAPFAGCESMHGVDLGVYSLSSANSTVRIMVWKSVISDVGVKMVTTSGGALPELKIANTLVNQWEEITFNFSDYIDNAIYAIEDVDQIVIFPDFSARTEDQIVYFDNITISSEIVIPVPMVAAPDPMEDPANVISMFSNVYTDVPVSTWLTPWSSGAYTELQIEGNDTKKYATLDFIGIETTGADLIDATGMDNFHIDVWSPNFTTLKVKLVDFGADGMFDGGDDSEDEIIIENPTQTEWISLTLPFSDFPLLTSRDNIAQLVISGVPTGSTTVYVDNIYFSANPSSISELEKYDFQMFPNPAVSNVSISANKNLESLRIINSAGELVRRVPVQSNKELVDIQGLPSGFYTIEVLVDGVLLTRSLIKR